MLYYEDKSGSYRTIFGHYCKRFVSPSKAKFQKKMAELERSGCKLFESDIDPVFRLLADRYMGADTPKLNVCFFDIEADFHAVKGFAPPADPFNAITAITLYLTAHDVLITLVLCPPTLSMDEGRVIADQFPDTLIFDNDGDLLDAFLSLIDDVDVISGWNSDGYDIPYLINRIKKSKHPNLGEKALKRFSPWGVPPRAHEYGKFGKTFDTYEISGMVHLDYLLLYQKHNTQQQHSYRLDFIGEIEVGENKTPYEGNLDDLYKKDFFRFIEYNRQDVMILVKIDRKRKFIELSNQIAHANCVRLKNTVGTVTLVDQAIINEMHKMGRIVPNRKPDTKKRKKPGSVPDPKEERTPVAGAYVATPRYGINEEIGCVDLASLYPSTLRALNMSPETIMGQVRPIETMALVERRIASGTPRAEAWEGMFTTLEVRLMHDRSDAMVTVDWEDAPTQEMTAAALYDRVFAAGSNLCITANGTLFRTDVDGMIPTLLSAWYAERKAMQGKAKEFLQKAKEANDEDSKPAYLAQHVFWDQRQLAGKIRLNALYGALLNVASRFHDERIGQSTTLSGRSIVKHMGSKINEIICGTYDHRGHSIVYGDTDSVYFSGYQVWKDMPEFAGVVWTREMIIETYDDIAFKTNATFPAFMQATFNTSRERGAIIKAARELVASKGLFVKKKKYAVLMYDKDGERLDVNGKPGKLKAMGLDLKRADTPKFMQDFLQKLLLDLLGNTTQAEMYANCRAFRTAFKARPPWEKGSPKKVSNLTAYAAKLAGPAMNSITDPVIKGSKKKKVMLPGHVRASLNWNALADINQDQHVQRINDGTRIIVCKLLRNSFNMDSVAYPIDEPHLPGWFRSLPFDTAAMETTIIDSKLTNLVGVLNWDLSETKTREGDEFFSFGPARKSATPIPEEDDDDED